MIEKPDYTFQKIVMLTGLLLLSQGIILYLTRNLEPFYLTELVWAILFISIGIWMIDWEANLYYKALKKSEVKS